MSEEIGMGWFRGRRVTVMGLGLNGGGLGISRWLLRHGARLVVTDLKTEEELESSVKKLLGEYHRLKDRGVRPAPFLPRFVLGRHAKEDFVEADLVIRNPAVPDGNPYLAAATKAGVRIETDMSIFFRLCPVPVIGVTGTKGKSTVTTLIGDILRRHDSRTVVAGNIRRSPFDELDRLIASAGSRTKKGPKPVVLELSSWHLEGLERHGFSPHIAVLTNVLEEHLNRYRGLAGYVRAKSLVAAFQGPDDFFVFNADDPRSAQLGRSKGQRGRPFAGQRFPCSLRGQRGDGCFVKGGWVVLRRNGKERTVLPVSSIRISGEHNQSNVLAACAATSVFGVPVRTIAATIKVFQGVPGRLETVARVGTVRYINDTTATMPDASIAALRAVSESDDGGRVVLIAGGADKKLKYAEWGRMVDRLTAAVVLLEGSATPKLRRALKSVGYGGEVRLVGSMPAAVSAANELSRPGDTVLLSPACASFGLFVNEFDRGDQFVAEVKKLARKSARRRNR